MAEAKDKGVPFFFLGEGRISSKFREFHNENPWVYSELVRMARSLKLKGRSRYGMKGLFEVLRWQQAEMTRGSKFKLNNNYTALYARLIMYKEKDLRGFFKIRKHSPQVIE